MRFLHTMIRVGNLERSIEFYTHVMQMTLLRQRDNEQGRYTIAFLGYGEEKDTTVLELTFNWDTSEYNLGTGFGHIAIGVDDVYEACDKIKASGGNVVREAGPMKGGKTILAFVEDPDGYKIELLGLSRPA